VLSLVLASTSVLFWAFSLLPFFEHGRFPSIQTNMHVYVVQLVTDVLEQPVFPIFKGQPVPAECRSSWGGGLADRNDLLPTNTVHTVHLLFKVIHLFILRD
jgi:hypothetical protein